MLSNVDLKTYLPNSLPPINNPRSDIPRMAKDSSLMSAIESASENIPTTHHFYLQDSRNFTALAPNSVHLVLTSPPYWILKKYRDTEGQLGDIKDYVEFLNELDRVWQNCFDALVPGGRLICVVGDVCLSRRKNKGEHSVIPLHSSIQERCRDIGYTNLTPIFWHKIANANYEVENGSSFLGKPYEPNAVIKNDIEYILMERKPGGYRKPSLSARLLSIISQENHQLWFQQIWTGITGASTRKHPAPFPVELAERLIRMFSFVGDTVLDPFMGTGTTNLAATKWGRNSVGIEVDPYYFEMAYERVGREGNNLFKRIDVIAHKGDESES